MATEYLFDSSGRWIAFRKDKNVFNRRCKWIGWLPWGDTDVVTPNGSYLGTIVDDNRLFHLTTHPLRGNPGHPGQPGQPGQPGDPGLKGSTSLTFGARNLEEEELGLD